MGLYSEGLMNGGKFASEIWGAYFREGLVFRGISRYAICYVLSNGARKTELRNNQIRNV